MLKKLSLVAIVFINVSSAITLDKVLELVQTNNASLQAKQIKVDSNKIDETLSDTWSNPIVGFGASDINLDTPKKRDIEAMQTQFITYSQTIPTNGKLGVATDIKMSDTKIKQLEVQDFALKLKSQALLYAYNIYFQTRKLDIVTKYIEHLNKQKELMDLLYKNGKLDQSKLVSLDIKIYKQKLSLQKITYKISQMKSSLENIIYEKVNSIELSDDMLNSTFDVTKILENHPIVLIKKEQIKKQSFQIDLEDRKKISDVKFTVGYYQRERFDDYMSFNVAIPLSIQGRENLKIKMNQKEKSLLEQQFIALEQQIKTVLDEIQQRAKTSKLNFELIENKMIPLNDDLEVSHKVHLSTNMMQSLEVYKTTNNKFELMLLLNDEKINYYSALAQLYYYKGVL